MRKIAPYTFFAAFISLSACTKDQATPLPDLTAVSPQFVAAGSTVIITGAAFSPVTSSNQVTFNGVLGTVVAATTTQLNVTVPSGAFTTELRAAEVFVTTEGRRSVTSAYLKSDNFPEIISVTPSNGQVGTVITIHGRNFNTNVNDSGVLFWGGAAAPPQRTPLTATSTDITVTIPAGAQTGDICLLTYVTNDKSKYLSDCRILTVTP